MEHHQLFSPVYGTELMKGLLRFLKKTKTNNDSLSALFLGSTKKKNAAAQVW